MKFALGDAAARAGAWARVTCLSAIALGAALGCSSDKAAAGQGGGGHGNGSGEGGAAAAGGNVFVSGCAEGTFTCDGQVAVPCDPSGSAATRDCAAEGGRCEAPRGCVVCEPGTGSCEGGRAHACNADGTATLDFDCDESQGMVCEPDGCKGVCSPAELGSSYVGCEYFPTVTVNPVFSGFSFAVAVANDGEEAASVVVTRGTETVSNFSVLAGALRIVKLPWVTELKGGDQDNCQRPPALDPTRLVPNGAYRLRSTRPVSVYQFAPRRARCGPSAPSPGCSTRAVCPSATTPRSCFPATCSRVRTAS
jgi:hypothetical protein